MFREQNALREKIRFVHHRVDPTRLRSTIPIERYSADERAMHGGHRCEQLTTSLALAISHKRV